MPMMVVTTCLLVVPQVSQASISSVATKMSRADSLRRVSRESFDSPLSRVFSQSSSKSNLSFQSLSTEAEIALPTSIAAPTGKPSSLDRQRAFFQVQEQTPWWRTRHGF
jgi:hypothetical protein